MDTKLLKRLLEHTHVKCALYMGLNNMKLEDELSAVQDKIREALVMVDAYITEEQIMAGDSTHE